MTLGVIGLGKMGLQIARRLHKKGFSVLAWNRSEGPRRDLSVFFNKIPLPDERLASPPSSPPRSGGRNKRRGGRSQVFEMIPSLMAALKKPRILWLMLPSGRPTEKIINSISRLLSAGDIIIDGSNSFYQDSIKRANKLARYKIHYLDAGVSGGVWGEKNGFSLMVGGDPKIFKKVEPVFKALAVNTKHCGLVGKNGSGHFVKMIHNGIEYGMMEALAEGFAVLNKWNSRLDLAQISKIWQKGSVVRSWLLDLCLDIFEKENLDEYAGLVQHTGEGEWTVKVAKKLGVDARVIEAALLARKESAKPQNQKLFRNKLLALLRNRFGGHKAIKK